MNDDVRRRHGIPGNSWFAIPVRIFTITARMLTIHRKVTRTRIVVKIHALGVRFVSRSEAKRLLSGLERFREVVLDFTGVEDVGQGFADEIFRVWARAHPKIRLKPLHMAPAVEFMVRRAMR